MWIVGAGVKETENKGFAGRSLETLRSIVLAMGIEDDILIVLAIGIEVDIFIGLHCL
jgi:hypothetical protein